MHALKTEHLFSYEATLAPPESRGPAAGPAWLR